MKPQTNTNEQRRKTRKTSVSVGVHPWLLIFVCFFFFSAACSQLETPKSEPFYAETAPPQKKEFRWSNGKMPKSFDPARAAAAPETDIARALYEGLTDTDPHTLQAIPAIAAEWSHSEDRRTWTFYLRRDARWSNGERVTAPDFVRSWRRLAAMGDRAAHPELLRNIVGLSAPATPQIAPKIAGEAEETAPIFAPEVFDPAQNLPNGQSNSNAAAPAPSVAPNASPAVKPSESEFGATATGDFTLRVSLVKPDPDFPLLVAHPMFRPVYGDGKNFETNKLNADIVTNGAFRLASVGQADGITLDRAERYWNRQAIELERVRFVPTESAEKALAAYRAGEVDAVTNADFAPLALKLLTPFEDFRRTAHSAVNFYEFNRKMPPFDDRRVREALTIAIERSRLTEDEMDGASLPARGFLPFEKSNAPKIAEDAARARALLNESGYPNGANFPAVKLLVNRNNTQQRIARSVAKMWKRNLNIETEIVARDAGELPTAWATDEFALRRRGAVLPTANELVNLTTIFESPPSNAVPNSAANVAADSQTGTENPVAATTSDVDSAANAAAPPASPTEENSLVTAAPQVAATILTEEQAMAELPAIPLYFPTSYSLVKPYIQGFDTNLLDAPSLKTVRIDNAWQPKTANGGS